MELSYHWMVWKPEQRNRHLKQRWFRPFCNTQSNLIDADKVVLWKDVPGIYSINPRWGIRSETIPYLNYQEAIELSHGYTCSASFDHRTSD